MTTDLCTIGFSSKNLRRFVELLEENNVQKLVDIRLHNTSQLAGYSKKDDLEYVMELRGIEYIHEPLLAPTEEIFKAYKKKEINWEEFKEQYIDLLKERKIEEKIDDLMGSKTVCLLCSEHKPHTCHRSFLAEYINEHLHSDLRVVHLM
ncbi:DUF488 domain-containing protein [Neobacillus sp. D3-1R]|uniref:DUF488 domain-containing protein n=1 Tax=Neobacillus sp. D3-1R TaxID=3445778 RepID=UPI003F9ECCF2